MTRLANRAAVAAHRPARPSPPRAVALALATVLPLVGCAGGTFSVKEDDKVEDARFDGVWHVELLRNASVQQVVDWRLSCGDMRDEFRVQVSDGVMLARDGDGPEHLHRAYVSDEGAFRLEIPIDANVQPSGTSNGVIASGAVTLILRGRLDGDAGEGWFVKGVKDFGNNGCTTRMRLKNEGSPRPELAA